MKYTLNMCRTANFFVNWYLWIYELHIMLYKAWRAVFRWNWFRLQLRHIRLLCSVFVVAFELSTYYCWIKSEKYLFRFRCFNSRKWNVFLDNVREYRNGVELVTIDVQWILVAVKSQQRRRQWPQQLSFNQNIITNHNEFLSKTRPDLLLCFVSYSECVCFH